MTLRNRLTTEVRYESGVMGAMIIHRIMVRVSPLRNSSTRILKVASHQETKSHARGARVQSYAGKLVTSSWLGQDAFLTRTLTSAKASVKCRALNTPQALDSRLLTRVEHSTSLSVHGLRSEPAVRVRPDLLRELKQIALGVRALGQMRNLWHGGTTDEHAEQVWLSVGSKS